MSINRKPHRHLILDAKVKYPPQNEDEIKTLLTDIIESIGMKVAQLSNGQPNPIAWYCDDPDNRGLTATAILTTSHVALHAWDSESPGELHFDLYSCSDFDADEIVERLGKEFGIVQAQGLMVDREQTAPLSHVIKEESRSN